MKDLFIQPNSSIKEALRQLDKSGKKCLIVTNKKNKLLGTLTDGDVRKALLKGKFLKDKINGIYEKNPTLLKKGNYSLNRIKDLFLKKKVVPSGGIPICLAAFLFSSGGIPICLAFLVFFY